MNLLSAMEMRLVVERIESNGYAYTLLPPAKTVAVNLRTETEELSFLEFMLILTERS